MRERIFSHPLAPIVGVVMLIAGPWIYAERQRRAALERTAAPLSIPMEPAPTPAEQDDFARRTFEAWARDPSLRTPATLPATTYTENE